MLTLYTGAELCSKENYFPPSRTSLATSYATASSRVVRISRAPPAVTCSRQSKFTSSRSFPEVCTDIQQYIGCTSLALSVVVAAVVVAVVASYNSIIVRLAMHYRKKKLP